jgi:transcriptional regulator with XRE-family HTH domain
MFKSQEIPAFGPVLRKFRLSAKLTQEELAARLGYETANYISCLEIGTRKPSVELLFKIADALNVKPSELIKLMEDIEQDD